MMGGSSFARFLHLEPEYLNGSVGPSYAVLNAIRPR